MSAERIKARSSIIAFHRRGNGAKPARPFRYASGAGVRVFRKRSGVRRDATEMPSSVLVVSDRIAASPDLIAAIRSRAAREEIQVRLLVPNPAPAEWHPTHPERHVKVEEAQSVLRDTLP